MFLFEMLFWLLESGWLLPLHLSGGGSFPKPLDRQEEQRLIERLQAGDEAAAAGLIEHNLRLVAHIARKYAQSGIDQEDLVSIGAIGLIKAVHTFRQEAGKLTAYASRCIENEMLMALRADKRNRGVVLLGETVGSGDDGGEAPLSELLGTDAELVPDAAELSIEASRAMRLIATTLDDRERRVIIMRYGLADGAAQPQHQVAKALGISRSYVSRIEKRALEKLKRAMEGGGD